MLKSKIENLKPKIAYWFFVGLIISCLVYVVGLLALNITTPADGYSASADYFSPAGFTIKNVLINRPNGLREGDLIVAVGGKPVEEWLSMAFTGAPNVTKVGQIIPYTVIRNGQTLVVPIKLEHLPIKTIFSRWGMPLFITTLMLAMGIFVFLKKPQDMAARAMLMMTLTFFVQMNSMDVLDIQFSDVLDSRPFLTFLIADWPGFGALLGAALYLALVFPVIKPFMLHHQRIWILLYIAPGFLSLSLAWLISHTWSEWLSIGSLLNNLIGLILLIGTITNVVHSYFTAPDATARVQMRWIIWGSITPISTWLLLFALPNLIFGHSILPSRIVVVPFLMLVVAFSFSIIKYRLMDIDTVINRSLVYLTLTTLTGGLYFSIVAALTSLLQWFDFNHNDQQMPFLVAIFIALIFTPLRERIQFLIDRTFYRNKLNFSHLLDELSSELTMTIVLSDLVFLLSQVVPQRLNISHADVMILDSVGKQFISTKDNWTLPLQSELPQYLLNSKKALLIDAPDTVANPLTEPLRARDIALCLPLIVGQKLVGLYLLGRKRSMEFYSSEEIGFLTTLRHQATVSIENARLYEQVANQERLKRELEIAHQIQMDLLPQSVPYVAGLEIAGYSMPAEEVGGDFYAYHSLPNERLGIAVGDVSGKGLPGALYMAISASVLEAHAPAHCERVSDLLNVVNRSLHARMKLRRMNTALAYMLFDMARHEVQISNAGLIAPLLLRGCEPMRYLDPNNLSLGATAQTHYSESRLTVQPGDVLIMISDGIIEAMNPAKELYGFERFEALITCYGTSNYRPQEIVNKILADVQQFVNGAAQHDDMTVVVVLVQV